MYLLRRVELTLDPIASSSLVTRKIASWHTSTHKHEDNPHAREEDLKKLVERFEKIFTITPQRLRMITDRFVGVLEEGLQKPEQTVVSSFMIPLPGFARAFGGSVRILMNTISVKYQLSLSS